MARKFIKKCPFSMVMGTPTSDKKDVTLGNLAIDLLKVGGDGISTLVLGTIALGSGVLAVSGASAIKEDPQLSIPYTALFTTLTAATARGAYVMGRKTGRDAKELWEDFNQYRARKFTPDIYIA